MNKLNNGVSLTWLGHATWLLKTPGGKTVLIDPFLDHNPACPDEYKGDGIETVDAILVTHAHEDHTADLIRIAKRTKAPVACMVEFGDYLEAEEKLENVIAFSKGGTATVAGIKVTLTFASHSSSYGLRYMGEPCGLIIELENGYTIYNAGDTDVFGDMALIAELYEPDLVMLPIGDFYTMGPKQAAKAVQLLKAKRVVPQHYGTFPVLTGTPEALQALVGDGVEILAVQPGGTIN